MVNGHSAVGWRPVLHRGQHLCRSSLPDREPLAFGVMKRVRVGIGREARRTTQMERSHTMGDKGGKKDKEKTQKQKAVKQDQQAQQKQDKQPKKTP
jgi:hypothetical protein